MLPPRQENLEVLHFNEADNLFEGYWIFNPVMIETFGNTVGVNRKATRILGEEKVNESTMVAIVEKIMAKSGWESRTKMPIRLFLCLSSLKIDTTVWLFLFFLSGLDFNLTRQFEKKKKIIKLIWEV